MGLDNNNKFESLASEGNYLGIIHFEITAYETKGIITWNQDDKWGNRMKITIL